MSASRVTELNAAFMRCVECHNHQDTREHLLRAGCSPHPPLKVRERAWFPPRGWAGAANPGEGAVFVLSTNPGHPLPTEEAVWAGYPVTPQEADRLTEGQASEQLKFVSRLYVERAGSTAFHTRSVQIARAVLWLVDEAERAQARHAPWFDRVWFTDVVKCSTARETGSPGIARMAAHCRQHLQSELANFKPRVLITLGDRAREALMAAGVSAPVLVTAPHPSGYQWRRIDSPELDPVFVPAVEGLGLRWEEVEGRFAELRTQLAQLPRSPL